ncbi:MAG TPA: LacI family DNA-binding transcriptional regulator [Intrasporangium sp.]|uniref:LacI family DNA-binding transcriptional regulator n=1 Tax=Intrasporangium sp. TaxID=1925024 RepID=UPI002D77E1DA|nr:LacI family DNA-binding transcriptional regulator [Intrasporangium sp.]HET7397090.1 LacI family DNA-binding transcriptional regulator [Intrasporangium sp.]
MVLPVRLRDVAEHAGVSVKTVSNVVHGHPAVSRSMRTRVEASIEALGYLPNISARSLRTGRSGLIGLAVPRISDPYFAEVVAAVIDAAAQRGLSVLVEQTGGDAGRETEVLHGRRPTIVDGLIFSPISVTQDVLDHASPTIPLILLGEHLLASRRSRVAVDNVAASDEAVSHLLAQGRRRIAAVGAKRGSTAATAELRLSGYRQALARGGVDPDHRLEVPVHQFSREEGASAVDRLVDDKVPFDALFCFSDLMALGALSALRRHGLAVPDEVAVVGFDNVPEGRHATPPLTTVAPDLNVLAGAAIGRLVERLDDPSVPESGSIVVPHALLVRESG